MLFRFLTQIYNNYRNKTNYRSSLFSYLKLLFERNKKVNNSYTNIGNVFKNSKWLSLKIQNVKQDFIVKWIPLILIQLFILGWVYAFNTDAYFGDIHNILVRFYNDVISLGYYSLLVFLSFIRLFINLFKKHSISLEVSNTPRTTNSGSYLQPHLNNYIKNPNIHNSKNTGLLYTDFYKVKNSNNSEILTSEFINTNDSVFSLRYTNSFFTPNYSNTNHFSLTGSLKLNELNHLLSRELNFTNLNDNLSTNFDSLRKDRWLLKNTLLDEDLIRNTNKYTTSKALIGSDFNKLDNVWASTVFSDRYLPSLKPNELKQVFTQNETNFHNLLSYNFFEESRFFLVKKYFFSNQIGLNLLEAQDSYLNTLNAASGNKEGLNSFFVINNLYNHSLNQHINSLFIDTRTTILDNNVWNSSNLRLNNLIIVPNQNLLVGNNLLILNGISSNNLNFWYSYL